MLFRRNRFLPLDQFFIYQQGAPEEAECAGGEADGLVNGDIAPGGEVERGADDQAYQHHSCDRADTKHSYIEHGHRGRLDRRKDQQHQSCAAGEAVHHSDGDRARCETVM